MLQATKAIRRTLSALHERASLRELAQSLGVSHQSVYKLLAGKNVRGSTLRRLEHGLAHLEDAGTYQQLVDELAILMRPLGVPARQRVVRSLGAAVVEEFERANRTVPLWAQWLSEGRRFSPTPKESLAMVLREAQKRSEGGA